MIAKLFDGKSSISNGPGAKMKLSRWNKNLPPSLNNIVLLTNSEFHKHIGIKQNLNEIYEENKIKEIETKLNLLKK